LGISYSAALHACGRSEAFHQRAGFKISVQTIKASCWKGVEM